MSRRDAIKAGGVAFAAAAVPRSVPAQPAAPPRIGTAFGRGATARVRVADSLTHFGEPSADVLPGDVCVGASFAGVPTAAVPLRLGVRGWIAHEAGPGRDAAGIGGLALSDRFGVPAAAIATMTARLSDGPSLPRGTVAHATVAARRLGVAAGQTGEVAAPRMLDGAAGHPAEVAGFVDERVHEFGRGGVYGVWSLMLVEGRRTDGVFCVASHGARVMAEYAGRVGPKGVIANDAGFGLDRSGVDGSGPLAALGIAGAAVSAASARIGDPLSTHRAGVISAVNAVAAAAGVAVGMDARQAARRMLEGMRP